jgi:hypothetical protein
VRGIHCARRFFMVPTTCGIDHFGTIDLKYMMFFPELPSVSRAMEQPDAPFFGRMTTLFDLVVRPFGSLALGIQVLLVGLR